MKRKIAIILCCFFAVLSRYSGLLKAQEGSLDASITFNEQNDGFFSKQIMLRYKLSKEKTLKYQISYRMEVWDDKQDKFVEDYLIKGILLVTMNGMDDKERYILNVESLHKSFLKKGKELSANGYDNVKGKILLKPRGGVVTDEEIEKNLRAAKFPGAHGRILRGLGIIFPVLPEPDAVVKDGLLNWKGCAMCLRKQGDKIEKSPDFQFRYEGKKEGDVFIIKGYQQDDSLGIDKKVQSRHVGGIVNRGFMHYDRKINRKIVLNCDMTATLMEE